MQKIEEEKLHLIFLPPANHSEWFIIEFDSYLQVTLEKLTFRCFGINVTPSEVGRAQNQQRTPVVQILPTPLLFSTLDSF